MADAHTGGCLCGAVEYETHGAPMWVAHCHCTTCRRSTGAPVTTFIGFKRPAFAWSKGEPAVYSSSPGVYRKFCARCGTPLTYEADRCADEVHVYLSTIDRPQDFPATVHVHHAEKIAWLDLTDDVPRYEGSGGG
jgi:hypothetical protein